MILPGRLLETLDRKVTSLSATWDHLQRGAGADRTQRASGNAVYRAQQVRVPSYSIESSTPSPP
jgi:hypothetical protein